MKHYMITLAACFLAVVWLTDFVYRLLNALWPMFYLAGLVLVLIAAFSAGRYILRMSRAPAEPQIIYQPQPGGLLDRVFNKQTAPAVTLEGQTLSQTDRAEAGQAPTFKELAHDEQWRRFILIFCFIGWRFYKNIFTLENMSNHVSDPVWRETTKTLRRAKILVGGGGGTTWAEGWNYRKLERAWPDLVQARALPLPAKPPPLIYWYKAQTNKQARQTEQRQQG